MGFGEARQQKKVFLVEFDKRNFDLEEIDIPVFQRLRQFSGNLESLKNYIDEEKGQGSWLELDYNGSEVQSNLRGVLEEMIVGSDLEILKIKNSRKLEGILRQAEDCESLENLNEYDVFERCLEANEIIDTEKEEYRVQASEDKWMATGERRQTSGAARNECADT